MPPGRSRDPTSIVDVEIPDKLYFKIGEVADLVGVETHVLRYWEKEITNIRPVKSPTNQRRYRRKDVETFREIKRLLYQERYTLAGARQQLTTGKAPDQPVGDSAPAPEPVPPQPEAPSETAALDKAKIDRVRAGLKALIRMAGEEP